MPIMAESLLVDRNFVSSICNIGGDTIQLLGQQFQLTHIPLHAFPFAPPPRAFCGSFMVQLLISMENLCVAPVSFLKEVLT